MKPGYTIIGTVVAQPETRRRTAGDPARASSRRPAPRRAASTTTSTSTPADPCVFMFYENWRSKEDLDRHLTLPHLRPLMDRQDELLARPVDIRHLVMLERPCLTRPPGPPSLPETRQWL